MPKPQPPRADAAPQPLNRSRAEVYGRLMEAQERIAEHRYGHGVRDAVVQAALDAVDERLTAAARREDLYLAALAVYVQELGGTLRLCAAFGDDVVEIPAA
jgi:hypothetical protein